MFQPRQCSALWFCLADPAHQAEVVLSELVPQDRPGGIDVDPLTV
jgi:hypothetical protein